MQTVVVQPWTTITSSGTVTQEAPEYVDVTPFDSAVFYLEVQGASSLSYIQYETAPAKDDFLFSSMARLTPGASTTTITSLQLSDSPGVPLARWVRWKVGFGASGSVTFKITASFR